MKMTTTIFRSVFARTVAVSRLRHRTGTRLASLLLLLIAVAAIPLHAQSTSNPQILLADFNGDGIQDVLVPSPATASYTLTFGAVPFGTFSAVSKSVPYPAGCTSPVAGGLATGDFNADGIADVAIVCTHSPSTSLSYTTYILLGSGDGTFTVSATFAGLPQLAAGDFNHDGKLDLVAVGGTGTSQRTVHLFLCRQW